MSVRSVIVRLEAEVAGYVAGMGRAGRATDDVARRVVQSRRSISDNSQAMKDAGGALMKFGAVSVAALGASAKAAMDWESAWAGVTKTVDGTPEQMDELEESLRGLAKTLPATHEEIAGVAEAAGQLGVKRQDIAAFTKTMIDLGETTNLTAEEAATDIAQIANVMGTTGDEIDNFGATLVALGNDGASTEKDILSMAQRIAGAGATVGATETEILALANTLSSMGVKAELGGGVTTRVLLKMYSAVKEGGGELQAFAKAAGMSTTAFEKMFGDSPVEAMDLVTKGLGRIKDEGGNVVRTMKDMGIKGTEELQVMLALAASGDLLTRSLNLGNKAWEQNTALLNEANKRYETTGSKIQVAWNNITDAAIEAGAVVLPVIAGVAESVSDMAQAFGSLPDPVKAALTVVGGVVGVGAVAGGAMLTLIPKIAETREAFRDLNEAGSRIPGTLGRMARGAAAAGAIAAVGITVAKIVEEGYLAEIDTGMGQVADALADMASEAPGAADGLDRVFKDKKGGDLIGSVTDLDSALDRTFNKSWDRQFNDFAEGFINAATGIEGSSQILEGSFGRIDQGLADMVSGGNAEGAEKVFSRIREAAEKKGISLEELVTLFPQYSDQLKTAAAEGKNAAGGTEALDKALQETGVTLDAVIEDMDKFLEQLFATGMITMSARDANAAYHESLREFPDVLKEIAGAGGQMGAMLNKTRTDFDTTTEAGARANGAFQGIARSGFAEVEAMSKEGLGQDELQAKLNTTYGDLIKAANGAGITGQAAVDLTRKVLGVPDGVDIKTWMDSQAKQVAEDTKRAVDNIPKHVQISIDTYKTTFEKLVGLPAQNAPPASIIRPPGKAGGGDLDTAPGPKGVDSQLFYGAKGEHVFTAGEVDKMGGQQAVYRFRAQVRAGNIQALASGGGIGTRGAVTSSQALRVAAGGGGTHIDLSGSSFTALDPKQLRRDILDDITYEINGKSEVRIV